MAAYKPYWLGGLILSLGLLSAGPGWAGGTPAGQRSGVTIGGSSTLSIGAASFDLATGQLSLTPAGQAALNQAAVQLFQQLQSQRPGLVTLLTTSPNINLNQPNAVGFSQTGTPASQGSTPGQVASSTVTAIATGNSVTITTSTSTLVITPTSPTTTPGQVSATATFTSSAGQTTTVSLTGTPDQVANAGAFLATTTTIGVTPDQMSTFTGLALLGVPYPDVVAFFNSLASLLTDVAAGTATDETGEEEGVEASRLAETIEAYNQIINDSGLEALQALSNDPEFTALGQSLRQLRDAIGET